MKHPDTAISMGNELYYNSLPSHPPSKLRKWGSCCSGKLGFLASFTNKPKGKNTKPQNTQKQNSTKLILTVKWQSCNFGHDLCKRNTRKSVIQFGICKGQSFLMWCFCKTENFYLRVIIRTHSGLTKSWEDWSIFISLVVLPRAAGHKGQ